MSVCNALHRGNRKTNPILLLEYTGFSCCDLADFSNELSVPRRPNSDRVRVACVVELENLKCHTMGRGERKLNLKVREFTRPYLVINTLDICRVPAKFFHI